MQPVVPSPASTSPVHAHPVKVPLVTEPMNVFASLRAARANVLSIIPAIATRQPMVSGRTGKRWHMVMDPDAIRRMLLENLDDYPKSLVTKNLLRPSATRFLSPRARIGAGRGVRPRRCFRIAT